MLTTVEGVETPITKVKIKDEIVLETFNNWKVSDVIRSDEIIGPYEVAYIRVYKKE